MFKKLIIAAALVALCAGSLYGMINWQSKQIAGNVVYYDSGEPQRLLDAFGPGVYKYLNDFVGAPTTTDAGTDPYGWAFTALTGEDADTEIQAGKTYGGEMVVMCDSTENDGANLYMTGEAWYLDSNAHYTYFGVKLKVSDADQTDLMVGLTVQDAEMWGGITDGIYFESADGTATLTFVTEKNTTETSDTSAGTLVDDTYIWLEFTYDGTTVKAYADGALVATSTTNIPTDEALTFAVELLTGEDCGACSSDNTVSIDKLNIIQIR